jgi:hypothetical protein
MPMTGSSPPARRSLWRRAARIVALIAIYGTGYAILDLVTDVIPEIRIGLLVVGAVSLPFLLYAIWQKDYGQPPQRRV